MEDWIFEEFYKKMEEISSFDVFGVIDSSSKIHTLGTDSKIIGRIFEMYTQPVLESISKKHKLILKTPHSQTIYPDYILMTDEESNKKIAIDIKTTYVDSDNDTMKFTLGSFGSYMRNNTKNIEYKYSDYKKHYVIGFVYQRNDLAQESRVFDYRERNQIEFPFKNVKFFIQEKYKIAGDKPGSGNTENIGSISTRNFDDFRKGNGPFSSLGQDVFELYWKYYPKYREGIKSYSSLEEFFVWFEEHFKELELLHPYNKDNAINKVLEYKERSSKLCKDYIFPKENESFSSSVADLEIPYDVK